MLDTVLVIPYFCSMTAIARELDQKLRTLDEKAATSLERLVRDALELVDLQRSMQQTLPPDFFTRIAEEFGPEPFDRPPQGETETRDSW